MIHVAFNRPAFSLKVHGPDGRLWDAVRASGAAAGAADVHAPYGPGWPIAPGHYRLTGHVVHEIPAAAEGVGRIHIHDLDPGAVQRLLDAGLARSQAERLEIAGLPGRAGNLARYRRSAVAIHGGGEGEDPLAPFQPLAPPPGGGVRVHNADLVRLMGLLGPLYDSPHPIVLSVVGDAP